MRPGARYNHPDDRAARRAARSPVALCVAALCAMAASAQEPAPPATEMEPAIERLRRDYLNLARTASATAAELARAREDLRAANGARQSAERDRDRAAAEAARLRDELRRTLDLADATQRDLSAAQDARIQLQNELATAEKALADARRRLDRIEKQSGDTAALRTALEELRRERDRWMRERADFERRLAAAQGRAPADPRRPAPTAAPSAAEDRAARRLEQERADWQLERDALEAQIAEAAAARQRDREEFERRWAALSKRLESLLARAAAAESVAVPPPAAESSPAKPDTETPPARSEAADELAALKKDRDTLNREVERMTEHALALERRLAETEPLILRAAEADRLAEALAAAQRELLKTREKAVALLARLKELESPKP